MNYRVHHYELPMEISPAPERDAEDFETFDEDFLMRVFLDMQVALFGYFAHMQVSFIHRDSHILSFNIISFMLILSSSSGAVNKSENRDSFSLIHISNGAAAHQTLRVSITVPLFSDDSGDQTVLPLSCA